MKVSANFLEKNSFLEEEVVRNFLLEEIICGLSKRQKELPAKLFYDEKGSRLFDSITKLDEYYPTRTETQILVDNVKEIAQSIGSKAVLIEYGSGSSVKTQILLDHLSADLLGYVSIDISGDYLLKIAEDLKAVYPNLPIYPIVADYTKPFDLPNEIDENSRRVGYFLGSTIGNFYPDQAVEFLSSIHSVVKKGGGFLIGVDLQKDISILNLAYNDLEGVTAEFNLNMLAHINNEFGVEFPLEKFEHMAFYNEEEGRIEMHLISKESQIINFLGEEINFEKEETILTEVSYKYSLDGFSKLVEKADFNVEKVWVDENNLFSVQYLVAQ